MLIEEVSQNVVYDLRTGLYSHMQELSYAFYDTHHIGEIMSRMTGDIEGVRVLVVNGVVGMLESLLMFVLSLVGMAKLQASEHRKNPTEKTSRVRSDFGSARAKKKTAP